MYWGLITEICELHWSSQTHYSRHFQDGLLTSKQKQPSLTVTPTGQTNSFCLFSNTFLVVLIFAQIYYVETFWYRISYFVPHFGGSQQGLNSLNGS
jgi:hypothetical protein